MLKKPPLIRKWYVCPYCGKKLIVFNNTAISQGVFIKCKSCGREVEIKIKQKD